MTMRTCRSLFAACFSLAAGSALAMPESSHTGSCGPSIQGQGESMAMSSAPLEAGAPVQEESAAAAPMEVAMASPASSAPASAPVEEAPAVASAPAAASAPAVVSETAAAPAAKARKVKAGWWPQRSDGKLNIVDVRSGEFSKTIVVQTDGQFQSAEAAASAIKVSSTDGQAIDQKWSLAANRKTLILPVAPGRYTVKIGTQLADASGKAVSKDSSGTVEVH